MAKDDDPLSRQQREQAKAEADEAPRNRGGKKGKKKGGDKKGK